jgi:ABC-type transporter lipoprotein component MlaA
LGVDGLLDPLSRISGSTGQAVRAGAGGVGFMDRRAQLIPLTDRLSRKPDYYVALRDHYASHRAALVRAARRGGEPAPPIDQDDDEPGPSPTAAVAAGS